MVKKHNYTSQADPPQKYYVICGIKKNLSIKLWCLVGFLIRFKQDSFMGSDILDDYQKTQLLCITYFEPCVQQ